MSVIEIDERIAAALRAQADARAMSLGAFLERMAATATPITAVPALPVADFERSIDEVATRSPVLPDSFSRADIYADHD